MKRFETRKDEGMERSARTHRPKKWGNGKEGASIHLRSLISLLSLSMPIMERAMEKSELRFKLASIESNSCIRLQQFSMYHLCHCELQPDVQIQFARLVNSIISEMVEAKQQ